MTNNSLNIKTRAAGGISRFVKPRHPEESMTSEQRTDYNRQLIANGTPFIIGDDGREYDINQHLFEPAHAGEPYISAHNRGRKSRRGDPEEARELSRIYHDDVLEQNVKNAGRKL